MNAASGLLVPITVGGEPEANEQQVMPAHITRMGTENEMHTAAGPPVRTRASEGNPGEDDDDISDVCMILLKLPIQLKKSFSRKTQIQTGQTPKTRVGLCRVTIVHLMNASAVILQFLGIRSRCLHLKVAVLPSPHAVITSCF
jgi:hypothetical protein